MGVRRTVIACESTRMSGKKNPHAVALGRLGGRKGGRAKTATKTAAVKLNGKLGGRPRKSVNWDKPRKAAEVAR